jgi:response regulator RpfG family c-di-GMP phosphodiesterase
MTAKLETSVTQKGLKVLVISQALTDEKGRLLTDLYVRMPSADRFVLFIAAGDELDADRLNKLYQHADSRIYAPMEQWKHKYKVWRPKETDPNKMGLETQQLVTDMYVDLLDDTAVPESSLQKLAEIAQEMSEHVLGDMKKYEDEMLKQFSDLSRMEDSYAIRSLATLMALANGYSSKRAILDINTVTMFMDVNLLDFRKEDVDNYYRDPTSVSKEFLRAYRQHPSKANLMATVKLPMISDTGLQMILNHHEYHNASGFPRGMRTKPLPDLVKILSLAVDVFERLKRAELNGGKLSLTQALFEVAEFNLEIHNRRHQSSIVDKVLHHLGIQTPDGHKGGGEETPTT